jgi:hypothetical protein
MVEGRIDSMTIVIGAASIVKLARHPARGPRKRPISALLPRVTKSRQKGPENRPFTRPGINVPGRCPTVEFRDRPALALFLVRLLREGHIALGKIVRFYMVLADALY